MFKPTRHNLKPEVHNDPYPENPVDIYGRDCVSQDEIDAYHEGRVYIAVVRDLETDEIVDSCGGYYGDYDFAKSQARQFAHDTWAANGKRRGDYLGRK